MTSLLQKINELNERVDTVISSNGGGDVTQTDLDTKQDVLTAGTGIEITNNVISSTGVGGDVTQTDLDTKQDVLTAGTGIEITNNVISSTGGGSSPFIGFRAVGNGTFAQNLAFGQSPSFYMIVYADQANSTFDSQGTYSGGFYTIPTGYSGWWEVSLKIYMLQYAETASMISIQKNNVMAINSGDFQGQRGDFTTYLKVIEGDVLKVYQAQGGGQYSYFPDRSWWQMRFIASSV
jgi:hypothetical protein